MRRVRYYEYGGPEVLVVEEVDVPTPEAGQVRIRAEAIGANFVDTKFRAGAGGIFQRPLPGTVTGDVVGTVDAVGEGVDEGLVGQRVAALTEDAFAEFTVADAGWLAPVPDGIDLGMASMLAMGAPVALGVLRAGRLVDGETVLVHAAAGGIGHQAVQLAKLRRAGRVIATAGSAEKLAFAVEHGADIGVNYLDPDWVDQVRAAAPNGVDVILDSIGGETAVRGMDLLAPLGRLVAYGAASGELPDMPFASAYGIKYFSGFSLLAWRAARPDLARQDMTDAAVHATAGRLRTSVHATVPLAEAAEAHRMLEARENLGRILVIP